MTTAQSRYKSVWDALEADPVQAKNLALRSALMIDINECCSRRAISTAGVMDRLCIDASRVVDLKNGRVDKFSLDDLVDMAHRLDLKVSMEIV